MATADPFANVPLPNFFEADSSIITQIMLAGFQAGYQAATGKALTLGAADPRRYALLYQADCIIQAYAAGNWVAGQNTLRYAVGNNLDVLGSYWGTLGERISLSYATTEMLFTIQSVSGSNITIPAGTTVQTTDVNQLNFVTQTDCTIIAGQLYAYATAKCSTGGTIGNGYAPNTITSLQNWTSPYVVSAYNTTVSVGGNDFESDDRYRGRLVLLPKALSVCGTEDSYRFYALSANSDIATVNIYSNPGIAGTVIITPLMVGGGTPDSSVLTQVYDVVSPTNNRPLSDKVIVQAPSGAPYSVVVEAYVPDSMAAQEQVIIGNGIQVVNNYIVALKAQLGGYIDPTPLYQSLAGVGLVGVAVTNPTFTVLEPWEQPILVDDPSLNFNQTA